MNAQEHFDIHRKLKILNYAQEIGNITQACRYYGISREIFYQWKRAYLAQGETALIDRRPCLRISS
jgi:transposase-like protein